MVKCLIKSNRRFGSKLNIKACKQASILLSSARDLVSPDYYELVIGGYANRMIIVRRKYGSSGYLAQVAINAPLSCDEFRSFVVNWSTDGNIHDNHTISITSYYEFIVVRGYQITCGR
jgi:hypothetical protein